jgi:hypothetical protein
MFSDALYYPTRGEQSLLTILIGGVLGLLSFLILPLFLVFGFYLRVLERTIEGVEEPPTFDDWGTLAVRGLVAALVTLAYYAIPLLVFLVLGGVGLLTGSRGGAGAGLVVGGLLSVLLGVAITYVYPAALSNYARTGSASDAFAFGEIKAVVTSGGYLGAWVIGFVIFFGGFLVVGILSLIPILGTLVGLFVNFYIAMAAYRVFGTAYRRAYSGAPAGGATTADAAI